MGSAMAAQNEIDVERLLAESTLAGVEHLPSIGSTQVHAFELAACKRHAAGRTTPWLVVADQQSAGRGRGANTWWSDDGSLPFSLIIDPAAFGLPNQPVPQASLAAGVALIDAVSSWLNNAVIGLHWPNDVFVAGRKLAGILIDVLPDGRHIVGVGVNVNSTFETAPEDVRSRAISLKEVTGRTFDRTDVLLSFLREFDVALNCLGRDPQRFGQRFNECCLQIGHDLTIEIGGRRTTGRCAGIAPDGALLLDTFGGRQLFYSGVLR
jgi:BirA family biotin operon repressor/biotin-[acetyl-CoA-carboxylase] ligase